MKQFKISGVNFRQVASERSSERSHDNDFVLVKEDSALQFYEALRLHLPKTIMEIGMFEGGSLVYFDKLFKPTKLVGVDRRVKPIPALEDYCRTRAHIETYYARYQDKAGVLQAARHSFPKGIDLVVDDASHLYVKSKATFNMLFPLLREGGHYVIERWRGPKWPRPAENGDAGATDPVSKFVHELIAQVGRSLAIDSISIHREAVLLRRGPGIYDPKSLEAPAPPPEGG